MSQVPELSIQERTDAFGDVFTALLVSISDSFRFVDAVGADNVDYQSVLRNWRRGIILKVIDPEDMSMREEEGEDDPFEGLAQLDAVEYRLRGRVIENIRSDAIVCHGLVGIVTAGLGGDKNLGYQTVIPSIGKCIITFTRDGEMWMAGRGPNADPIAPETVTKKRLIKMGAILFYRIPEESRPQGYYWSKGFTSENICLGAEYACPDPRMTIPIMRAVATAASRTDATREAGITPGAAASKALKVMRARLGNEPGFPSPDDVQVVFEEFPV